MFEFIKKHRLSFLSGLLFLVGVLLAGVLKFDILTKDISNKKILKLYWFIPDGLRAEPEIFQLFEWAEKGYLPNIYKLMKNGAWGYSKPVFPSHTPTNFATLLTGTKPSTHGVSDGAMHLENYPLNISSLSGFSSVAKRKPPIWYTLEERGMTSTLIAVPGSTPPEISFGHVIKGRWGGWGFDFPAINFHSALDRDFRRTIDTRSYLFQIGAPLTKFVTPHEPYGWDVSILPKFISAKEVSLENWGVKMFALLLDSKDDQIHRFDKILCSKDKKQVLATLREGGWSQWLPVTLVHESKNDYSLYKPQKNKMGKRDVRVQDRVFC